MVLKATSSRSSPSYAAEPAGPLELPYAVRSNLKSSRTPLSSRAMRLGASLAAVLLVYTAHSAFARHSPAKQQQQQHEVPPVAADATFLHSHSTLLAKQEQQHLPLFGDRRSALNPARDSPWVATQQPGGMQKQPVSPNCTVRLADADEALLRDEIDRIAKALADEQGWPVDAPDATAKAVTGDQVRKGEKFKPTGALVQRVVDEPFGPQSSVNVPGVEDIHAELAKYSDAMVAAMTLDEGSAAARQHRARIADLHLEPVDDMATLGSLEGRVQFLNQLAEEVSSREALKVCIAATTNADVWAIRRELLPWLQYHTELGVTRFYLVYDGIDQGAVKLLRSIRSVQVIHLHQPWATAEDTTKFEFYAKHAKQWGGQPGNYELMVKQGYGLQEALRLAEVDGWDWLLHIDPDELFHPGGPAASIPAVLARQPPHVPAVRFMNFEAQPEAGDIANRFEQVTLFRVHKHFITPDAHFYRQKYKLGDNAVFLTLYANGKSAVRVGGGARQMGPHFFSGNPSPRWQTQENPRGEWRDVVSDDSVILHYAYSTMADVESKANRSCPASYLEAARQGDKSKLRECFVIEFDQDAYLAAAAGRAAVEDFFYSRMVLSEGSRVRCRDPENDNVEGWCTLSHIERFKYLLEKLGLYRRIQGPQLILRLQERAIRAAGQQSRGGRSTTGDAGTA